MWQMFGVQNNLQGVCENYWPNIENSWLKKELYAVRNIRPAFKWGLWAGLVNAVWETLTQGLSPWTLKHHADHTTLKPAAKVQKIEYDKPDGVLTFDRLSSVFLANLSHDHTQPKHLLLREPARAIDVNLKIYDSPESRYCPAGVYEIVHNEAGEPSLQINAQNCVHCKTCDIKDPTQNIHWVPPEGGSGPNYGLV
jgi:electron-transferring-flavoprotein dehydrogenase